MRTLSILSVAIFLVIGLASCDKEDTAIMPANDGIIQQNGLEQIEANGNDLSAAIQEESNTVQFGVESQVRFQVYQVINGTGGSTEGALTYDLRGNGEGNSPNYGQALVRMRLVVNSETGEARGFVNYAFEEAGINLRFRLRGNLSTVQELGYSELISRLIPNQLEGLEALSGNGTTYIFGDLFHEMQQGEGTWIQASVVTKALITE